jgi:flagellar hook protein FlgE
MIASLQNGISALKSFTEGLQVLGNNIANSGSVGYKSSRVNYSDNFYLHLNKAESGADGAPSNNLHNFGTGVNVSGVSSNFSQGVIENTAIDLDVAIDGEALPNAGGFFEVTDPANGELYYTRVGSFDVTNNGKIVTRDQFRFEVRNTDGESLSYTLEEGENLLARKIDSDGTFNLILNKDGVDYTRSAGQISLANFQSPQYLRRSGNGYFTNGSPGQDLASKLNNAIPGSGSNGKVNQYALELSNVDLTNEFAMMITHQRSFQAGSRVVTTSDQILNEAINLKR